MSSLESSPRSYTGSGFKIIEVPSTESPESHNPTMKGLGTILVTDKGSIQFTYTLMHPYSTIISPAQQDDVHALLDDFRKEIQRKARDCGSKGKFHGKLDDSMDEDDADLSEIFMNAGVTLLEDSYRELCEGFNLDFKLLSPEEHRAALESLPEYESGKA